MPKGRKWCYGAMDAVKTGSCVNCRLQKGCFKKSFSNDFNSEGEEL